MDISTYKKWFYTILLIRKFEERVALLYMDQKIRGFCHLYNGQEACVVGVVSALSCQDKYITSYRDHAHPIALGVSIKLIMAELFGKKQGLCKGKGGSMHLFSKEKNFFGGHGIVCGQVPLGIGIAFSEKYKKTGNLCAIFMGDGAVRQGAFHESLNLAMLYKLPAMFIVENNLYAMGTSVWRSSNVTELHKLANSYEMHSVSVDAMDVEAVYNSVFQVIETVRLGIPVLMEFRTYRYKGHSIADSCSYRKREEVDKFKNVDPLLKLEKLLVKGGDVDSSFFKFVNDKVNFEIDEAVKYAEKCDFPSENEIFEDVYNQANYQFLKN